MAKPSVTLSWSYLRAVLLVASDWAFGSALGYLALALFWGGWLGRGETLALAMLAVIHTLNRVALIARIIHGRLSAEVPASPCGCSPHNASDAPIPDELAPAPAMPAAPASDTTTSPTAGPR